MNSNEISEQTSEYKTEISENVLRNDSATEYVSDDAAKEYEEIKTGIRVNYSLTPNDIYTYFWTKNDSRIRKTIFQSALLGILSVLFFVSYANSHISGTLFFAVISAVLIPVLWCVPKAVYRQQARKLADGQQISMEIFPDKITLTSQNSNMSIPLDGSVKAVRKMNNIIFLFDDNDRRVILPLRYIEQDDLAEVTAIIQSGTAFEIIE